MDCHNFEKPEVAPNASSMTVSRAGLLQSALRAATKRIRRASYLAGAVAVLFLIPAVAITLFGGGSGRGWAIPGFLWPGLGVCLTAVAVSGLIGSVRGLFQGVVVKDGPMKSQPPRATGSRGQILKWLGAAFGLIVIFLFAVAYVCGMYIGAYVDKKLALAAADADRDDPFWRIGDVLSHRASVPEAGNSGLVVVDAEKLIPNYRPDGVTELRPFLKSCHERLKAVDDDCRLRPEDVEMLRRAR